MKKKIGIIIAIIVVIMIIIVSILLYLDSKEEQTIYDVIYSEWANSIPKEQPEFLNAMDELSSFDFVDIVEEPKDYFTVTVDTYSPNISETLNEYQEQMYDEQLTEEEVDAVLCEIIYNAPINTTTHYIYVIRDEDNNYHVNFSESFIDAMFGYAYTDSMKTLNEELSQIMKGDQ